MAAPVIPQNAEQARQRDSMHALDTGMPTDPAHELAKLRNAARGEIHGRIQTIRGQCTDEEPHENIDAKLAELDDLIWRLAFPERA